MLSGDFGSGSAAGTARGRDQGVWLVLPLLLVYWPAWLGSYVGDDHRLIERNPAILEHDFVAMLTTPLFGIEDGYWRPLTVLGFWLGHTIAGAVGVHLLAFGMHVAATFGVRELARRCTRPTTARWIALAFALHPVQVESVAWCSALNDVIWSLLALGAILMTTAWRDRGGVARLGAVGACCLLAMLAKETGAATLLLVLAAAAWLRGREPERTRARVRWPTLLAVLTAVLLTWSIARTAVLDERIGSALVGLGENEADIDPARLAELLVAQLALLVWPLPLLPVREVPQLGAVTGVGAVVLAVAVLAAAWHSRRDSRWAFALALLLVPLLPSLLHHDTIGLYPIADRYLYLPTAGGALLVACAPWPARMRYVGMVLLAAMAFVAVRGAFLRHDDRTLAAHTLGHMPHDPCVLAMAANAELPDVFDGNPWALQRCERLFRRALAQRDGRSEAEQRKRAIATAQLGLAWCGLMRWSMADAASRPPAATVIGAFQRAVELDPRDPAAWVGLGIAAGELRQFDTAQAAFENALIIDPRNAQARAGLRSLAASRGGAKPR